MPVLNAQGSLEHTPSGCELRCWSPDSDVNSLYKRAGPGTESGVISRVNRGEVIRPDRFVSGEQYLWAHDTNGLGAGWVAVRERETW